MKKLELLSNFIMKFIKKLCINTNILQVPSFKLKHLTTSKNLINKYIHNILSVKVGRKDSKQVNGWSISSLLVTLHCIVNVLILGKNKTERNIKCKFFSFRESCKIALELHLFNWNSWRTAVNTSQVLESR